MVEIEVLREKLDGVNIPNEEKTVLSFFLHKSVIEYCCGINLLLQKNNIASANALLRVLFEAHVKGLWIFYCAKGEELTGFKENNLKSRKKKNKDGSFKYKIFQEYVDEIEKERPHLKGSLKSFKKHHWEGLNALTHTGVKQLSIKITDNEVFREYPESRLETIKVFSSRFSLNSFCQIASITNCKELQDFCCKLAPNSISH